MRKLPAKINVALDDRKLRPHGQYDLKHFFRYFACAAHRGIKINKHPLAGYGYLPQNFRLRPLFQYRTTPFDIPDKEFIYSVAPRKVSEQTSKPYPTFVEIF